MFVTFVNIFNVSSYRTSLSIWFFTRFTFELFVTFMKSFDVSSHFMCLLRKSAWVNDLHHDSHKNWIEITVHFRKSILGKFFVRRFYSRHISSWLNFSGKFIVWRFYSRHISSWLNYSGEFIVRRFYSSRNNRTPICGTFFRIFRGL